MKTSSTSEPRRRLPILPLMLLGAFAGWVSPADARKPRKGPPPVVVEPVIEPAPAPVSKPIALFSQSLPMPIGGLPVGLANTTAQGCAACHFDSHAAWAESPHATGWRSPAFQEAVTLAATPACTSCHLPLLEQSPTLDSYEQGDINKPLSVANPAFDASLRLEGVTCAACHLRDGAIVATRPPEELGPAPHPMVWSKDLTTAEGCATCHQLQWEGATSPFYDTYGEWKRSPHAAAGITCSDCHGGGGAARQGYDHDMNAGRGRALSILLHLDSITLVRGDEPIDLGLTLQNTGAGHAYPTGSPFTGVQVRVRIVGPKDRKGKIYDSIALEHELGRTLTDGAPWDVTADTRIPAGGQVELKAKLSVPYNAADGEWYLRVELMRTVRGEVRDEPPLVLRELPLQVE